MSTSGRTAGEPVREARVTRRRPAQRRFGTVAVPLAVVFTAAALGACAALVPPAPGHPDSPQNAVRASVTRWTAAVDPPRSEARTDADNASSVARARRAVGRAAGLAAAPRPVRKATGTQRSLAQKRAVPIRHLALAHGDGEPDFIELYDSHGAMRPEAWRQAAGYLGQEEASALDPRLLAMLYLVVRDFDRPIRVVSAHRAVIDPTEPPTAHIDGNAVDFYLDEVSTAALYDYCLEHFGKVGIGYRPAAGLVHLELSDRRLVWVDTARAGQRSRERLTAAAGPSGADVTLESPHLSEAQLYPTHARPKASKLAPEKPKAKKRKAKSRKGKRRRGRGRRGR